MSPPGNARAPHFSRRIALVSLTGACIAAFASGSTSAQESAQVQIQLDQQALNTLPGDERADLNVQEDTSPSAGALKARSQPGKAIPVIYLVIGVLSIPSIWSAVQEMLRRHEYGGVVIDTRTTPANIHHDQSLQADLVMVIRTDGSMETIRSALATDVYLKRIFTAQAHSG